LEGKPADKGKKRRDGETKFWRNRPTMDEKAVEASC